MNALKIATRTLLPSDLNESYDSALYTLCLVREPACFSVDDTTYTTHTPILITLTPHQHIVWQSQLQGEVQILSFHGDFYCIEYHKEEVACNGILFNNPYLTPYISLYSTLEQELIALYERIAHECQELEHDEVHTPSVIKSYLQVLLALCTRAKHREHAETLAQNDQDPLILKFRALLEQHYTSERSVIFYAQELQLSTEALSRKCRAILTKTPTQLIQDRVIIEAKRLLHLTYLSIKEIAATLHFDDEYYFSRYFKRAVGVSPKHFRQEVGISIVAKISI